jgi:two-component system sensor histidine kinase DesK
MTTTSATAACNSTTRWSSADGYYLGFLSMLLFQPTFDPAAGTREWIITAVTIVVFAPLYVIARSRAGRLRQLAAPLSVLLALAVFWFNGGATVLLIYAAAFVGAFEPRRIAMRWFAGLSLLTIAMGALAPVPLRFALIVFAVPVFFIWLVGLSSIEETERARESNRLRVDNARIGHLATAAERERIARDLHDVLGQSLTEIIVRAQLVRRLAQADGDRAATEAAEIERASRSALDEVRAVVRGWREVRVDEELDTARRSLVAAGMILHVDRDPTFDPAPTSETTLALAIREAVTNVIRHADAATCTIALRRSDGNDVVEIADDGSGRVVAEGAGLLGMRERVLALGGAFGYTDRAGVTVSVRVPTGLPT